MPSLRSIFTLQDNYSRSMDRIWNSTQRATSSIGKASSAVDTVSNRFTAAEGATSRLTQKLTGLAAAFLSFETVKKGMEISDTYTNINSKLSLITQNARQLKSLQNDIFAAADRARGSYTDMADTVAKLGIIAGSQFGSNQNIVKFTETMQKMFKIGGTPVANQAGAMLQLQQAIGLGRLQGQDLRILAEDAPLVETAIAKYMGKSVGDVRQLGTQGKITSEVLINSILQYSGTVDQQIGKMKYTWGDYWNKIKNGAYRAFGGVFDDQSKLLGSANFQNMINGLIGSFYTLANVANGVMTGIANIGGFVAQNWSIIEPILITIAAAWAATKIPILAAAAATAWKTVCDWAETAAIFVMIAAQDGLNAALAACPVTWIIAGIVIIIGLFYLVVAIVDKATHQAISATGVIIGCLNVAWEFLRNLGLAIQNFLFGVWDAVQVLIHNLGIAFPNLWADLQTGFLGFVTMILNGVKAIGDAISRIPGMKMDTSGLASMINSNTSKMAALQKGKGNYEDIGAAFQKGMRTNKVFQSGWASSAYNAGYKIGQGFDKKVKNWTSGLGKITSGSTKNKSIGLGSAGKNGLGTGGKNGLGTSSNPATVKGTSANGSVQVNIADQDLQYLRDLAEKQYVNKFSTAVLSPKLTVNFSGNVGNKNDEQRLYSTIGKMMREEMATEAEGYYPV